MTAAKAIAASRASEAWFYQTVHGLESARVDDRSRLALSLFDLVHEYQSGILDLLDRRRSGAACALVRPLLECYLRGFWLLHCASDDEVQSFMKDEFSTKFAHLIAPIERRIDDVGGVLTRIKDKFYGAMSSYTHGGYMQAARRIRDGEIGGARFSDEEIADIATLTNAWALAAAHEIYLMANQHALAAEALERAIALPT